MEGTTCSDCPVGSYTTERNRLSACRACEDLRGFSTTLSAGTSAASGCGAYPRVGGRGGARGTRGCPPPEGVFIGSGCFAARNFDTTFQRQNVTRVQRHLGSLTRSHPWSGWGYYTSTVSVSGRLGEDQGLRADLTLSHPLGLFGREVGGGGGGGLHRQRPWALHG